MSYLRIISRILVGIIFIYSGFVKGIDPLGSTYKFEDYFEAFGMGFFEPFAFTFAVVMNGLEFLLGVALLVGVRMRIFSIVSLAFMSFFTILTFILAVYNPVSDCGCFGDALILTNWETFWKNVLIMVFVFIIFFQRKKYLIQYKPLSEWIFLSLIAISFTYLTYFNYQHLPMVDFRPYKVGTYLQNQMTIPEGAPTDKYETTFQYKHKPTNKIKTFSANDYPWQDTINWEFVSYENKLVLKGYTPPIHDFSISSTESGDITDRVLNDPNYTFLLISHKIDKANTKALIKMNDLAELCATDSLYSFYAITSSPSIDIENFSKSLKLNYPFYVADDITLKTIIRSNPGLVLIKNGTVIGKWHYNNIPEVETLMGNQQAQQMALYRSKVESLRQWVMILLLGFIIVSCKYMVGLFCCKKND